MNKFHKFQINVTRDQWLAVAKIVLAALLAIAAVFGYDLGVIQPREQSLQISSALSGIATRAAGGVTRFTSNLWLQNSGMTIDKTLDVTGVSTLSGGVVGDVTGNLTGNVTGNISGSATSPVVTATTRITTPLITVNGVADVGSLTTTGDVSARNVTATGGISVATVSTFNQAVNAFGGIDTNGTSVVLDGDGHSWITAPTEDQLMMVTGSGERMLVTDAGTLVTGTLGVSGNASAANVSAGTMTATTRITTTDLNVAGALSLGGVTVPPIVMFGGTGVYSNQPISHGLTSAPNYIGGCTAVQSWPFTYTIVISEYDSYSAWITFYDPVANVEVTDVGVQLACFASP